jgi:hypothetical protein
MLHLIPRHLPPLGLMVDDLGRPRERDIARALGVTVAEVSGWLADDQAPRVAMLALYWLTQWGLSELEANLVNQARIDAALVRALRNELEDERRHARALVAIGDFGSANDPAFSGVSLRDRALSLTRLSPHAVSALRVTIPDAEPAKPALSSSTKSPASL